MSDEREVHGPTLRELQERFGALLQARMSHDEATPPALTLLTRSVVGDERASAVERLELYGRMARARRLESLAEDFPKLRALMDEASLDVLLADYLAAHPSTSPSLRDLGSALPAFLRSHAQTAPTPWLAELAQLEWTRIDLFDRPDERVRTWEEIASHAASGFASLSLEAIDAHALISVDHPVAQAWRALDQGEPVIHAALARREPQTVLVWRQPDRYVYHRVLEPLEARCLALLARGVTFVELCAHAAEALESAEAAHAMAMFLAEWTRSGLIKRS